MLIDFGYAKLLDVSPVHDENEGNGTESSATFTKLTPCVEQQNIFHQKLSKELVTRVAPTIGRLGLLDMNY